MTDTIEYRSLPLRDLETRIAPSEEGTFSGYACRPEIRDSYGTAFAPGCWTAGGLDDDVYAMLWMHDETRPVGTFRATEDDNGLRIDGRYDDTPEGQSARARALSGSAPELSVGFVRQGVDPDDPDHITNARLVEVSAIVARMASQPGAALTAVRAAESRLRARCVSCKRFVSKPLCAECRGNTKRSDDQREVREMDPPAGSYEAISATVEDAIEEWAQAKYSSMGNTPDIGVCVNATFPDRVIATVYDGTDDDGYTWQFPYVIGDGDVVTLGEPTAVELVLTVEPAEADDLRSDVATEIVEADASEYDRRRRLAAALRLATA